MKAPAVRNGKSRGIRRGWDAAFKAMAAAGDDKPLLPDALDTDADAAEWTW